MSPKITSKRDPDATIGGELRKELGKYWAPAAAVFRAKLNRYPRQAFAVMIACILVSGILAFTVFRQKNKEHFSFPGQLTKGSFTAGPGQFIRTASALQAVLALRGQVDAILQKARPDRDDSLKLAAALRQLDSIQHSIHQQP